MSVILAANYRRSSNPTVSVPAPVDGKGDLWWYDHIARKMPSFRGKFKHLLLNPLSITIGGPSATSDGYGVWWRFNNGKENGPTRFGYDYLLQRLCAIAYRNGILPMMDWVPHQNYGGRNGRYRYKAWGGPEAGRYPLDPSDFRGDTSKGWAPQDPVPDKFWDIAFGDELSPELGTHNGKRGYALEYLQKSAQWNYERYQLVGDRNDDTKGQALSVVRRWSQYGPMKNTVHIGEYAEGNKDTLRWWLDQVPTNNYTYDFEIKYRLRDMCNTGSHWDMRQLRQAGLATLGSQYAGRSVTFVENPDSDTNGFGATVFNKLLAYAYILTAEGWPSVYWRDYAQEKYCYGLAPKIDNLVWCHEVMANGPTVWRHEEYQFVVYERTGYWDGRENLPGCLVGLNNDVWDKNWKKVQVQTSFGSWVKLHDYAGHGEDAWTDGQGRVTISIPPNNNGAGYVVYGRDGLTQDLPYQQMRTTQIYEGAADLLEGPATAGGIETTKIWPEADTEVRLDKRFGDGVRFSVLGPDGEEVIPRGNWAGKTKQVGWHVITAYSMSSDVPYKVATNYLGTESI
jgi:alpha-amylase